MTRMIVLTCAGLLACDRLDLRGEGASGDSTEGHTFVSWEQSGDATDAVLLFGQLALRLRALQESLGALPGLPVPAPAPARR